MANASNLIREHIEVKDVLLGDNVTIIEPVNLYGCEIGDNTFVGPFVEIQKNVKIGSLVKVQSHTFICENVQIGNNVFIGHGVMFINDAFQNAGPANGDKHFWKPTFIGDNVSIGSNATILPVCICSGVIIGAGSVVTGDIDVPGVYYGNPARWARDVEKLDKDK